MSQPGSSSRPAIFTRRRAMTVGRGLGLLAFATSLGSLLVTPSLAGERVVFGTPGSLSDNSLAVQIAIDKGFYTEAGIDAEIVNFKGGAPEIQALVGGGIQYAIAAPEHVFRLRSKGVDAVIAFALQHTHTYALVVRKDSPIKTFDDLKGKTIGITSPGSLTENLIRFKAHDDGLEVGKDLTIIGAGVGAAQKAALDTGRTDAGMFGNIEATTLVEDGYRIVYDWRTQRAPGLALVVLDDWQTKHPKLAESVVKATLKAQKLVFSDHDLTVAELKKLYPGVNDSIIETTAAGLRTSLSPNGLFDKKDIDKLQSDLKVVEPTLKPVAYGTAQPGNFLN